jgi:glycogen debranching enzyme
VNQGWKDSEDSVFHADGRLATGSIALCEVQGYAYLARVHAARLARTLGREDHAGELERAAGRLREQFERDFWCEDLGAYALALDGDKRACRVVTSNAGHVLWSGIASDEHARRTGSTLMSPRSFSGWGVRTLAEGEPRYNPMSYHDGSIWPHDNAIIAMGLARYGMKREAAAIARAMYDASVFADLHRLPELFCGFARGPECEGPTLYPVACSPQAWASAAVFYLLKACLGLSFRPEEPRIRLLHPVLPEFVDVLTVRGLAVAGARVDLRFVRHGEDVGVQVLRRRARSTFPWCTEGGLWSSSRSTGSRTRRSGSRSPRWRASRSCWASTTWYSSRSSPTGFRSRSARSRGRSGWRSRSSRA